MTRTEFTFNISTLLLEMFRAGEQPILDFAKRSAEEQKRLYDAGLSQCDGVKNISKHQRGLAVDVYFVADGKLVDPKKGWEFWHDEWLRMGGKPIIQWDKGHFEV
jgi:hypothetical protein